MAEQEKQRELNIREYLQILSRRRWIIYTCVLVATVAATAASFIATPIYRSTGTIKIERAGIRILRQDLTSAQPSWLDYQNFYNTQYRIIGSDRVLRQAVEQLDLVNRPGLFGKDGSSLSISLNKWKSSLIRTISRSRAPLASEQDELAPYIKLIRGGLSVDPVRESFLVEISYISPDPELAAEVANAVADAYRYFTLSEKMDVATQSTDWFVEQIETLKSDVGTLENELQEYSRRHRIVLGQEGAVSRQNFVDLRQKFSQAQASTTAKHAALDKVRRSPAESLDEVRANTLIRDLTRQLTDLRSRHDELRTTFGADYPEVRTISTKIDSQTQLLEDETQKIAQTVLAGAVADYQESLQQEKYLAQLLDRVQSEVEKEDRAMGEYQTKRSELEQKRGTLEDLMTRQNEMNLSAALGDTAHNVRTIDFAEVPTQIFRPKKKLNIMIGLLFGLFLGVAASVLMEFIDNTLKTPDDVRAILGVPVLGLIPSQEALSRSNRRKRKRSGRGDAEDLEPALISAKVPLSPIAEAYRELRTALLLATPGHPPRDLSVTSCQPSEGKTTTAINLAIGLSQLGRRVLVVDTDLRRPRCHHILNASAAQGVSNYLTGMDELDELIQPTEIDRLFLLPSGPVPPNPAELLDSKRFLELQERLRDHEKFEHVVFDSPPVLSVVDPLLIGRHTDGTVLVVRSAFTSREAGRLGKEKLDGGRVNLLGVVLNAVDTAHVPYQYRYYRYGYGRPQDKRPGEEASKDVESRPAAIGGSRRV